MYANPGIGQSPSSSAMGRWLVELSRNAILIRLPERHEWVYHAQIKCSMSPCAEEFPSEGSLASPHYHEDQQG